MLRKLALSSLILFVAVSFLGCQGGGVTRIKINKDKRVYVGTVPFEPPLLFQQSGALVGPEANIVQALADKFSEVTEQKVEPFWITRSYGTLAAALTNQEVDFIVSVYGITESRKSEIQFSDPYYTSDLVLIINPAHKPDLRSNDLSAQKIGVREGTGVEEKVTAKYPSGTISPFTTLDDAILALRRGEIDAVVDDANLAAFALATAPGAGHLEILPGSIDTVDCAIAVRKRDSVIDEVNEVVAQVKDQYPAWIQEFLGDRLTEVRARHDARLEKAKQAAKPRRLEFRISKDANYKFDIYRFANLSFVLTDTISGNKITTSRIDFQGRTGVCSANVPPGTYQVFLPKFNFSPGQVRVVPADPDRITANIRLLANGNIRMTRR